MSILNSQTKLQQLQKKSADALGIFQNTVNNLADTNANIRTESKTREDSIKKLQEERCDGTPIKTWTSSGKVLSEESTDGYYFKDKETGALIEVTGNLVITKN